MNGVFEISANVADEQEGYCLFTLSTTHTSLYPLYTSSNMPDCVAIVQDLPFRQSVSTLKFTLIAKAQISQVIETAMHISRSVATDQTEYRDFMTHFDTASISGEGEQLSAEKKQEIIRDLVTRVTEGQGCLQGAKETGAFWHEGHKRLRILINRC
jgi:hypothetical protein